MGPKMSGSAAQEYSIKIEKEPEQDVETSTRDEAVPTAPPNPPVHVVETEGGTDEEALRRRPGEPLPREVDFYREPTLLSRLILYQKFGSALKRIHSHPEEACVWVCAKRPATGRVASPSGTSSSAASWAYLIRQLPIHMACANLCRTHDFTNRKLLHELLATLIFANPEGAHEPDHQGRLPLHDAVWYGADADTIALFLMAKPEALHATDRKGRSLRDLNRHRPASQVQRDAIQHLLDRSVEFWTVAKEEAQLRLKRNNLAFPSDRQTLSSISNLASSAADDETIMTTLSQQPAVEPEEIPPISWEQLERRAISTEQILTEINEQNYELNRRVEALTVIDQAQSKELVRELTRLNKENALLGDKLYGIENLLIEALATGDEEKDQQYRLALAEISSLMGLSDSIGSKSPVLDETKEAKALRKELSQRTTKQRDKIRKMRIMVEGLFVKSEAGGSGDSQGALSTVSPLTSGSSKSSYSPFSFGHPQIPAPAVGQQQQQPPPPENEQIDDLDVLLQYAAAHDHAHRIRRRQRHEAAAAASPPPQPPTENMDDLSAMLHWAAAHESPGTNKRDQPASVSSSWSPVTPKVKTLPKKAKGNQQELELPALLPPKKTKKKTEEMVLPAILPPKKTTRETEERSI